MEFMDLSFDAEANPQRITHSKDCSKQDISGIGIAVLFPIYNEEAAEVYARLTATYESFEEKRRSFPI